jgi:hypothetical protein
MVSGEASTIRNFRDCTVQHTVKMIGSRRLKWEGHVARMEECRIAFNILTGKLRERDL